MLTGLVLLLEGCAQVTVKDEIAYGLKGPGLGAFEAHTLTSYTADLSEAQWEATVRAIMAKHEAVICMSSNAFADAKAIQEQLCSFNPTECNQDTTQAAEELMAKVQLIIKRTRKP